MKKTMYTRLLALLLAMLLLPGAASASSLLDLLRQQQEIVPDPAALLGEGELFAEHYELLEGFFFTAYRYPLPAGQDALDGFVATYLAQAAERGFTADSVTIEDCKGYLLTGSNASEGAVLLPDFYGDTVLLVSEGLSFEGAPASTSATAAPTTTAAPEQDNYISFTRNGREMSYTWPAGSICMKESTRSIGTSVSFEISCHFKRQPITYFALSFPVYAQAGDEFYVTSDSLLDGINFYTAEEGSLVFYDSPYYHQMTSSRDYLRISITSMENTSRGLLLEGTFSGSFNGGETLYENGSFRVLGSN